MVLLLLAGCLLLVEVAARIYLSATFHVGFFAPRDFIHTYYPSLKTTLEAPERDDTFDVLILGPSVLAPIAEWGAFDSHLQQLVPDRVRLFNLSTPAHTSLDSLTKYRLLEGRSFDLVIVYHGINDLRADACAPETFRADYTHMLHYEVLDEYRTHPEASWVAFPFATALFSDIARLKVAWDPQAALRDHGPQLKTPPSFRHNISEILDLANARGEEVLLCTFAFHVPGDYSLEKFKAHELDYGAHKSEIELWGLPNKIVAGLEAHEQVVRDLHAAYPDVHFLDAKRLLPGGAVRFDDICHLTPAGLATLAARMAEFITP